MGKNDPWYFEPELARAKKRAELEAILSTTAVLQVKVADPGSTAIATYLAALGLAVSAEVIAQWLNLVPVLALELGSALALVLVASLAPLPEKEPAALEVTPLPSRAISGGNPKSQVANQIVNHLTNHGGSHSISERRLAKQLGADRNMVRRSIQSLVASGVLATQATKTGTFLELIN
jgi:hypothetical protein